MGYAAAAGLPAICGLYATIVPLTAYAIFGPSRILVLGPDSALAALIAATVLPLAADNVDRAVALAGMLAILSGGLCILAGFAKFGSITELLSKPIRYGYMNGIAVTVLLSQLPTTLGFPVSGEDVLQRGIGLGNGILQGRTNWASAAISLFCLLVILGCKRWVPRVPGVLIAVGAIQKVLARQVMTSGSRSGKCARISSRVAPPAIRLMSRLVPPNETNRVVNPRPPVNQRFREFRFDIPGSEPNLHGWFRTPVLASRNRERHRPLRDRRKPLRVRQETRKRPEVKLSALGVNWPGCQFRR